MKKMSGIVLLAVCLTTQAQIKLKDDSVHPTQQNHNITEEQLKNLVGYGMYTATIVGYANSCNFPKDQEKMVFDHYFTKLKKLNLSHQNVKNISDQFTLTAQEAKAKGVKNSNLTCDQFKVEFNKIIQAIKEQK